jgi:hypothetical protein
MSELENLINRVQQGIDENRSYIKTIRHPKLLLLSLKELQDMIGNDKVKDAVASDISHLIMSKMRTEQHPEMKEDEVMLNIVLKGEPGVGKTVLATKIGKIFYSLGYLQGSKKENSNGLGGVLKGVFGDTNNTTSSDNTGIILYILFIFIVILITFISVAWSFYEKFGGEWTIAMIIVIIALIILVGYLIAVSINENNEINNNVGNTNNVGNVKNDDIKKDDKECPAVSELPSDSQIIKVVSREDFVDQYVGWTAPKTKKLLTENIGKVLFVDEAYSLVEGLDDKFGVEAATTLNLFMSQHPNEIIVIFAGYKNLLERGIFTAQPGLKRRFMYHFQCDGYTPEQLFKIFKVQLAKKGWGVTDDVESIKIFIKEKDAFPFSGGDTERLTHYAKVEHSKEYMKKGEGMKLNKLSPIHILSGISKLRENSGGVKDENDDKTSNLMKMMEKYI